MLSGRFTCVITVVLLFIDSVGAQGTALSVLSEVKLTAADAAQSDEFGLDVAISGDVMIVGAPGDDTSGSAYLFVRDGLGWTQQAKFSFGALGAQFGISVAVSGDTALVGAWGISGGSAGSAYVLHRNGGNWSLQGILTAADGQPNDHFGRSVALAGDYALIGAPDDDQAGSADTGSAYVFVRSGVTWSQQAKLLASNASVNDNCGYSVTLSEDGATAIIGAWRHAQSTGAAYVFARAGSSWTQQAILTASDGLPGDFFGTSLSTSGDTVLVGSSDDDHSGASTAGSAYVYIRNGATWSEQAKLTAADAASNDSFGYAVTLSGDMAVVGAPLDNHDGGNNAGSAYVYRRNDGRWIEVAQITTTDASDDDKFGISVAVQGDEVIAGAFEDDTASGSDAGSAYAFTLAPIGTWANLGFGMAGTAGVPALSGDGYLIAATPVTLALSHAKPLSSAPLVIGLSAIHAPFAGGTLVPFPNLIYFLFADGFGTDEFNVLWPTGAPSEFTFYAQWWVADPVGPGGYAASNAISGTTP